MIVGASGPCGAEDRVGAIVGMCVQSSSVAMLTSWIWLSSDFHYYPKNPDYSSPGLASSCTPWAVVDLYAYGAPCKGATIRTDGSNAVCIVDLSLDDPVESDAATGSVPRALLVLLLPGLLALGLL